MGSPVQHLRDYLSVLVPLLEGKKVDYEGDEYQVHLNNASFTRLAVPIRPRPQVLVAALGPGMLRVAGELADGTSVFWCGPHYIEHTVVPVITTAAAAAGRPAPDPSGIPIRGDHGCREFFGPRLMREPVAGLRADLLVQAGHRRRSGRQHRRRPRRHRRRDPRAPSPAATRRHRRDGLKRRDPVRPRRSRASTARTYELLKALASDGL